MSLYVTSSCGLTNPVSTITDEFLSLKPDSTFDLVQYSTGQDILLPQMKDLAQSYAKLNDANHLQNSTAGVQHDSGQDSDTSGEDTTQALLNSEANKDPSTKPGLSYIALISMAIQSVSQKKMLLSEIYQWITDNFPYYQGKDKSWRNSIRHNLSLNECFIKNGRSENGKGNYWSIHPANVDDFEKGDFRRRRARRRVRKCDEMQRRIQEGANMVPHDAGCYSLHNSYIPMMSTFATTPALTNVFGAENVMSKEEQLQRYYQQLSNTKSLPHISNVSSVFADSLLNTGYQNGLSSLDQSPSPPIHQSTIQHAASIPSVHQTSIPSVQQMSIPSVHQTTIPSVHQTTIQSVHQTTIPSVHQTSIQSVHQTTVPSVHQTSIPSVHQTAIPSVHQTTIPSVYQTSIPAVHQTSIPSVHHTGFQSVHQPATTSRAVHQPMQQSNQTSLQTMTNVSFQDNLFTPQVQIQTLPSMSQAGALPSWQDTLSRLQTGLGGTV